MNAIDKASYLKACLNLDGHGISENASTSDKLKKAYSVFLAEKGHEVARHLPMLSVIGDWLRGGCVFDIDYTNEDARKHLDNWGLAEWPIDYYWEALALTVLILWINEGLTQ